MNQILVVQTRKVSIARWRSLPLSPMAERVTAVVLAPQDKPQPDEDGDEAEPGSDEIPTGNPRGVHACYDHDESYPHSDKEPPRGEDEVDQSHALADQ